ncbi:unnamed protein product [Cylindrotheca closterium]|uniref:RNA-dependent RNA polymerase n=1 Tax=Cylindrotheca closterium TaxID=2856 RepID=A0AAD2G076_9STRA|nr:unnamed protein product [Cylindrotheca closterium]
MPSLLKKLRHKFRRRKSTNPRSNSSRKNKEKIEPPNSPSSILQIEEIQQNEIPEQSSRQVSLDDEISRLSMPSFIEDEDTRAGGGHEEPSFAVGTASTTEHCPSKNWKQSNSRESEGKQAALNSELVFPYTKPTEVPSKYPGMIGKRVKVRESLNDAHKRGKIGHIIDWKDRITVTMKCDDGGICGVRLSSIEFVGMKERQPKLQSINLANKQEAPDLPSGMNSKSDFPFASPMEAPAKCSSILGLKVKVRDSLSDSKKRGRVGEIVEWKTKNTVSLKCEDGQTFGVRVSSIDFVNQQPQSRPNEMDRAQEEFLDESSSPCSPESFKSVKSQSNETFVTARMDSSNSSNDSNSRTGIDESTAHMPSYTEIDEEDLDRAQEEFPNESSAQCSPESFKSVKSQSTEEFVTARMDSVNGSNDSNSAGGIDEPIAYMSAYTEIDEEDEVLDQLIVPTATLTKAPTNQESFTSNDSFQNSRYKEPTLVPAKDGFIIGKRVKVRESLRDSKKRGKFGNVVSWKNKSVVEVQCDEGTRFGVRLNNIDFANGHAPQGNTSEEPRLGTVSTPMRRTPRCSTSKCDASNKPKTRAWQHTSRKLSKGEEYPESDLGKAWIAPQNPEVMPKFGGFHIEKLVVGQGEKGETTFLNKLLMQRKLIVEVPLSTSLSSELIERRVKDSSGKVYELLSCKTYEEATGSKFVKRKFAKVIYAQTEGPGLEPFAANDFLRRVGDFTTLPPRKIAARLELFQSPSSMRLVFNEDSWFQQIPDLGYVGGGFIHEDTLFELLRRAGMKPTPARRVAAIQVRLFIPSMGVFKGMLVKKRVRNGAPIELPCSMQKVLKSTHPQRFDGACILICRNKVHPSPGSANEYIGRNFDGANPPPLKSFTEKIKKPLSTMLFRLWETMGVPKELCDRYKKESLLPSRRNHAWVVGVPDPTGCLPPDTVFVPGIKNQGPYDFFVTRFPCYAHEHGRKFRSFTEKPPGMSTDNWDWLNNELNFGVVIFSNPREGMKSIPERIANGDLDGDLYLVCWDKEVVNSLTALPLEEQEAEDDGQLATVPANKEWFHDAQDVMIDNLRFESKNLIGALYNLAKDIADNSDKKLNDPDALALFEAYNEALEYQKHGRPVRLPRHLISELKPLLHSYVEALD